MARGRKYLDKLRDFTHQLIFWYQQGRPEGE
jgi:hypothetical protein